MKNIDAILIVGFVGGFIAMFCGCIFGNVAVQGMRRVLNEMRAPEDQLRWHDAIQRVAQNVIDAYRSTYPNGPLNRKLAISYRVAGIGGATGLLCALALRFF